MMDQIILDHLFKGGEFDATKITKKFGTVVRIAQLVTDLEIGTGLNPLEEKKDDENDQGVKFRSVPVNPDTSPDENEVDNLRTGNPKGPSGCVGSKSWVCHSDSTADQTDDNGAARSGEVHPPQQQSVPTEPGPGTGRGHSGGPEST